MRFLIKFNKLKTTDNMQVLKEFLAKAEQQYNELLNKYKMCQEQFNQCVEYFGEAPRSQSPNGFFTTFVKFLKAFNVNIIFLTLISLLNI